MSANSKSKAISYEYKFLNYIIKKINRFHICLVIIIKIYDQNIKIKK